MTKKLIAMVLFIAIAAAVMLHCREAEASSAKVTVGSFLDMLGKETGVDGIDTDFNRNGRITVGKAVEILVKAYEILYGEDNENYPDSDTVEFVIKNRIANADEMDADVREWLAKAYLLGLVSGEAEEAYSARRVFKPKAKCTESTCRKLIKRLTDPEQRYKLSPDHQLLRVSKKNRPVLERFYSYILDSYPNAYYDCMFNFMIHQAKVFEADESPLWNERNCTSYCGVMTWDTTFSRLTYEDRIEILSNYSARDRLKLYCAYLTPAEYDSGAKERLERDGYAGMALTNERKRKMADTAEKYVMSLMNVDYRTIAEDTEWREQMMRYGIEESVIDSYIAECIKDELIIECDRVAADISGIYYDRTPFAFTKCMGVVHTYAHYRVVSDNGRGFPYDELVIVNGEGHQCLRNGVIGSDGYKYVREIDNSWQDGFFDIGMDNEEEVYTSIFDIMRYKAVYIADFGYPCETPNYYPGQYTIDGVVKYKITNRTKEQYLKEWGYLYNR